MDESPPQPEWYLKKRRYIADYLVRAKAGNPKEIVSPSGKYRLNVTPYQLDGKVGPCSRGVVSVSATGHQIAQVDRNIGHFPASWCEDHPIGHDYLICGEDYQGQTIIELDTGKRLDYIPPIAQAGGGFCWTAHYPSPDGKLLFVDGCYWAAPYEIVLMDFCDPMSLPYHEFRRWPVWEVKGFQADGSFLFEFDQEVRKADGKPVSELTEEDRDILDAVPQYEDAYAERRMQVRWKPDWTEEIHEVVR